MRHPLRNDGLRREEKGMEAVCCIIENTEDFEGVAEAVCQSIKSTNVKVSKPINHLYTPHVM